MNTIHVGIFYYLTTDFKTGELLYRSTNVVNPDKTQDAYSAGYHVDLWKKLQQAQSLPSVEHEYFPRGRINYMIDYLEVIADKCIINNPDFRYKVESSFPFKKYVYIKERKAHYSCHKCNKDMFKESI